MPPLPISFPSPSQVWGCRRGWCAGPCGPRSRLRLWVAFQARFPSLWRVRESLLFLQSYNKLESHQTLNESVHWIKKKVLLPDSRRLLRLNRSLERQLKINDHALFWTQQGRGWLHSSTKGLTWNSALNKSAKELNRQLFSTPVVKYSNILMFVHSILLQVWLYLDFPLCLFQSWHFTSYLGTVEPWNCISLS